MQVTDQSDKALILETNVVLRRVLTESPGKCTDKGFGSERNVSVHCICVNGRPALNGEASRFPTSGMGKDQEPDYSRREALGFRR